MYLGTYEIDGDPNELLAADDRLTAMMPEGQVGFHACATRENGLTIYDARPTKEVSERFSTSTKCSGRDRGRRASLPPRIEGPPLHSVRAKGVTGA